MATAATVAVATMVVCDDAIVKVQMCGLLSEDREDDWTEGSGSSIELLPRHKAHGIV